MDKYFVPKDKVQHMQIVMGYQCNQKCIFCYQEDQSANNKINPVIWKKHLKPIYENLKSVTIIGGEPTVMSDAEGFMTMLYENYPAIRFETITNGFNFRGIWQDVFIERGANVTFSLHAATSDTYSQITRNGKWDRVVENIKAFSLRRNANASSVKMKAIFVIVEENMHEIVEFIHLCNQLSMDECSFNLDFRNDNLKNNMFYKEMLLKAVEESNKIDDLKIYGLQECLSLIGEKVDVKQSDGGTTYYKEICPIPWNSIHVAPDGFVSVCCSSWLFLGNINNDPIDKLWNNRVAIRMRKCISNKNYSMCKNSCSINVNPRMLNKSTTMLYPLIRYFDLFKNNPPYFLNKAFKRLRSTYDAK